MTAVALTTGSGKTSDASVEGAAGAGRPTVMRAELFLHDSTPTTGGRKIGSTLDTVAFQFNPKELTITKSAKWERKNERGAKKAAAPQFSGADPCKLTLEMFFDASGSHDGSVVCAVEKLFACCIPTEKTSRDDKPVPPLVVFKWGAITSFPAFITQVSAKYTLFSSTGMPIRATCSVTLEEMPGENSQQNPTSGSLSVRRARRVNDGDTLATVAYDEYGDATLWRALAEFNGIDDPLRVPTGAVVMVPSAAELVRARD